MQVCTACVSLKVYVSMCKMAFFLIWINVLSCFQLFQEMLSCGLRPCWFFYRFMWEILSHKYFLVFNTI